MAQSGLANKAHGAIRLRGGERKRERRMAGLVEAQGDGDFILESARSGVVGVDRNHRPGGRLVENRDFPRMEKIMNRLLDED